MNILNNYNLWTTWDKIVIYLHILSIIDDFRIMRIFRQDLEGIRLYIGISPTGIRIYQAGDMVRMNSFNWAKVLQVILCQSFLTHILRGGGG